MRFYCILYSIDNSDCTKTMVKRQSRIIKSYNGGFLQTDSNIHFLSRSRIRLGIRVIFDDIYMTKYGIFTCLWHCANDPCTHRANSAQHFIFSPHVFTESKHFWFTSKHWEGMRRKSLIFCLYFPSETVNFRQSSILIFHR